MAILLMLLSSAAFTTMAAMVKGLDGAIPIAELILLRCLIPLPFFVYIIKRKGVPLLVQAKGLILLRSLAGAAAMACFYYALTNMPIADCVFLGRSQPFFLALLAPILIGEKAPKAAWGAIGAGLVGVFFIMKPGLAAWPIAAWASLSGAGLAALAHISVRQLNRTDQPLVIVFNFFLLTALMAVAWSVVVENDLVVPQGQQWLLIVGIGVFASLGQFLMTCAYRYDKAPVVAASSYASIILSVIYGYWFWGEMPQPLAWVGALLILAGGLILIWSRRGRGEKL
ncbi:MAG: DMT family transporter [Thermodesulfobacteriota bacterium]